MSDIVRQRAASIVGSKHHGPCPGCITTENPGQRCDCLCPTCVAAQHVYRITRSQLVGAIAGIQLRVPQDGPMARKVLADDMADAILRQIFPESEYITCASTDED